MGIIQTKTTAFKRTLLRAEKPIPYLLPCTLSFLCTIHVHDLIL